jgi:hypothetical protein
MGKIHFSLFLSALFLAPAAFAIEGGDFCDQSLALTVKGESRWNGDESFSSLENLGVQMSAVDESLASLGRLGFYQKALMLARLNAVNVDFYDKDYQYNRHYSSAIAIAKAVDPLDWPVGPSFTQTATWTRAVAFDHLLSMGVRFDALERALFACYRAGYLVCVISDSRWEQTNHRIADGRYSTTGTATVSGRLPKGAQISKTASGESTWTGQHSFSVLEVLGVRMTSVENAFSKLADDGSSLKALMLTTLNKVNVETYKEGITKQETTALAVAQALDGAGWVRGEVFAATNEWRSTGEFSALEIAGIRYDALQRALSECYERGYLACVGLDLTTGYLNNYDYSPSDGRHYRSSATAKIVGYNPVGVEPQAAVKVEKLPESGKTTP